MYYSASDFRTMAREAITDIIHADYIINAKRGGIQYGNACIGK